MWRDVNARHHADRHAQQAVPYHGRNSVTVARSSEAQCLIAHEMHLRDNRCLSYSEIQPCLHVERTVFHSFYFPPRSHMTIPRTLSVILVFCQDVDADGDDDNDCFCSHVEDRCRFRLLPSLHASPSSSESECTWKVSCMSFNPRTRNRLRMLKAP